ncbi:MAG: hypothetical protein U0802_06380 [Candidatus Binatia bacterium]
MTDFTVSLLRVIARGADGEAYNVGDDREEISMRELAERIRARDRHPRRGHPCGLTPTRSISPTRRGALSRPRQAARAGRVDAARRAGGTG